MAATLAEAATANGPASSADAAEQVKQIVRLLKARRAGGKLCLSCDVCMFCLLARSAGKVYRLPAVAFASSQHEAKKCAVKPGLNSTHALLLCFRMPTLRTRPSWPARCLRHSAQSTEVRVNLYPASPVQTSVSSCQHPPSASSSDSLCLMMAQRWPQSVPGATTCMECRFWRKLVVILTSLEIRFRTPPKPRLRP